MSTAAGAAVERSAAMSTAAQPHGRVERLLLATDLEASSELATEWAFDLARRHDATLLVLSVVDPRELRVSSGRSTRRVDRARARREEAAIVLVERGRRTGVHVTFLIWTGDPGEAIVEAGDAEDADLILVGSHGRGSLEKLVLGSVSEHVVRRATRPVLVVRSPSTGQAARREAPAPPERTPAKR